MTIPLQPEGLSGKSDNWKRHTLSEECHLPPPRVVMIPNVTSLVVAEIVMMMVTILQWIHPYVQMGLLATVVPLHGRDHFVYPPSQWETTLHCNVVSHWLGAYTKWSLPRWQNPTDNPYKVSLTCSGTNPGIASTVHGYLCMAYSVHSRLAPSQWETSLQSSTVSHWLGANLESALGVYLGGILIVSKFHKATFE